MSNELIELSNALAQATDRAAAQVVAIHTESRGSASGIIWRPGLVDYAPVARPDHAGAASAMGAASRTEAVTLGIRHGIVLL